jgi:hypothetical protein
LGDFMVDEDEGDGDLEEKKRSAKAIAINK